METVIMHPKNKEQLDALKAIAKALKVAFETDKGSNYDPAFVAKILAGERAKNEGEKGLRVDVENLWK
jgi:pimeloyl-CoA synthetase